jgi:hypothetical protein
MKLLFVDTETNGLPASRWIQEKQWKNWPEIIQLSWEIWIVEGGEEPRIESSEDHILKQEDTINWSTQAETFHKIPLSLCQNDGKEPKIILQQFKEALLGCDGIVAHNLDFDRKVIRASMYRYDVEPWSSDKLVELCTMRGTQGNYDFGLDKAGKPKAPTLVQLHNACIPGTYDCSGAGPWHSASHDLHCAALCFWSICSTHKASEVLKKMCQLSGRKWKAKELSLLIKIKSYSGK